MNYSQAYGRPIIGNIVTRADDSIWFTYLQYMDGAMQERFAVDWAETSYVSVNQWLQDMDLFERTQASGKYVILLAPGYQNDIQRETFAFASYLLISNGKAAFRYSTANAYRDAWLYDNYKVNLGSPVGGRYQVGSYWRRDFTNGSVVVDPVNHTARIFVVAQNSDMVASVGDLPAGGYNIPSYGVIGDSYMGVVGGPVKVVSRNGNNFFISQRAYYGGSFSEIMGYPANQFTTEYWFPWYDNTYMTTWILVGNPSSGQSANVDIYIGSRKNSYTIPAGGRITPTFPGVVDGPVRVVSTNGQNIFASERAVYGNTFSEIMGFPASQFATEYWFPWYDNKTMTTWVLVGNPSSSQSVNVNVRIGSSSYSYLIPPGGRITPTYPGIATGPVQVVSTNGQKIFASERVIYLNSFNEVMGYPGDRLSNEYWFPWYDNTYMSTTMMIARP